MPLDLDEFAHITSFKYCDGRVLNFNPPVHLTKMQEMASTLTPLQIPPSRYTGPTMVFEMDDEEHEMTFEPIKPYERTTSVLMSPRDVVVADAATITPTTTTTTVLGPIESPTIQEPSDQSWRRPIDSQWKRTGEKRTRKPFPKRPTEKTPKMELHSVLNCFQLSEAVRNGIYVGENFKDPRYAKLDSYYYDVQDSTVGFTELRKSLGPNNTPLSRESYNMFVKLQGLLGNLADRIGKVLDQQEA